ATASTMPMLPARSPVRSTGLGSSLTSAAAMVLPASSCGPCESPRQCVEGLAARKGANSSGAWDFSIPQATLEPHHIADDFGHRLVVLGRHIFVHIHRRIKGAGERGILDDRDVVLLGDLADLERDVVLSLGDADRRIHAALVFQRD